MGALFGREAVLFVGGTKLVSSQDLTKQNEASVLRFAFHTEQSLAANPNKAEVIIYNLSAGTRSRLQDKGLSVSLEAGYAKATQLIFKGKTRTCEHRHEGAEWVTKLGIGDGELEFRQKRVSLSFGPNTSFSDVVKKTASTLGLSLGNLEQKLSKLGKDGKTSFANGFVADGRSGDVLTKLFSSSKLSFSVQNEAITVLDETETTNEPTITLSAKTGLIGSPEAAEKDAKGGTKSAFYKIKALLNPGIRPGRRVQIDSGTIKGSIRVEKVEHQGDTAGGEWYTNFEGKPIVT